MDTHPIHRENDTRWTHVSHSQGLPGGRWSNPGSDSCSQLYALDNYSPRPHCGPLENGNDNRVFQGGVSI